MKRSSMILCSALLLAATGLLAAESPQPPAPTMPDKTATESSRRPVVRQPPEPVYRPSEKISADSAVTFPVDI